MKQELKSAAKEKWEMKTKIMDALYEDTAFIFTDFNHPIFTKTVFKNCLFRNVNLKDARIYDCQFIDCTFKSVHFATVTIGAHNGLYQDCTFTSCRFRGAFFYNPEFIACLFNKCQWKSVDLSASYFDSCKFIGKLEDVTFRGYHESDLTEGAKPNPMKKVDFSEAIFGEFVGFTGCDLSTAIPPVGYTFEELLRPSKYGSDMAYIGTGENGMLTAYQKS
ncbi:pentapeptide repeat-containing protein [Isobaculum melis]|uniref:Uncharacterized protein YjbI, contains pentapeptide repeats n=1 Tax=Isobaculum melis TaxID=142588 RepID=A0A1H9S2A4_9LACT|nr:pentapeptide repeat-containing protein [Isobaculum melis]SER79150.1 Uncharacterized protein YjbI, contains pentapeptide repeats [Isobaculum melis]